MKRDKHISKQQFDRIEHIFQFMEYDNLTDDQHTLIVSFEKQFKRNDYLSPKQIEILEDIFMKAASR